MKARLNSPLLLYVVWLAVMAVVLILSVRSKREITRFYGIADTREIVVNAETAVEIKRINVVEGQSIRKGQLLVELRSPELAMKINEISHQLEQLKVQKGIDKAEVQSRISQLEARKAALENETAGQIRQIKNQYNLNLELASGLRSIPEKEDAGKAAADNPLLLKIESLQRELSLSLRPINLQIELLQKSLRSSDSPIKIQVEQLQEELALLKLAGSRLNIYARISGIIGSVNFKPGEKVAPFSPILTLHTPNPSLVKGYISENVYTRITTGKTVTVSSLTDGRSRTQGLVVGVGSRIVAYPVRLRRFPDFQVWGREVVIQIPHQNHFILGEKVLIDAQREQETFWGRLKRFFLPPKSYAKEENQHESHPINPAVFETSEIKPLHTTGIEASAVLYLPDKNQYILVSDDTPDNRPLLFQMDPDGRIVEEIVIKGLPKINDLESITAGPGNTLFLASSLSWNKKGKTKEARHRLIQVRRENNEMILIRETDLYKLLKQAAAKNPEEKWSRFFSAATAGRTLDMEAIFYNEGDLYLGFKAPFFSGRSIILRVRRIETVLEQKVIQPGGVSIWRSLKLGDPGSPELLSGLLADQTDVYATTRKLSGDGGSVWKISPTEDTAIRISPLPQGHPEGIALCREPDRLLVCFDQGNKHPSRIQKVRKPQ